MGQISADAETWSVNFLNSFYDYPTVPMSDLIKFFYLYIASVYTTIELVSTIGYGDITPVSIFNVKLFMIY
jgi:hypothetical protein